jgi:hypothetical protein
VKTCYFSIFNHKFTQNTKINALENNKSKSICNHENGLDVRLWESGIWLKVKGIWLKLKENVQERWYFGRPNIPPQLKVFHDLMQPCIDFPELCDGVFFL